LANYNPSVWQLVNASVTRKVRLLAAHRVGVPEAVAVVDELESALRRRHSDCVGGTGKVVDDGDGAASLDVAMTSDVTALRSAVTSSQRVRGLQNDKTKTAMTMTKKEKSSTIRSLEASHALLVDARDDVEWVPMSESPVWASSADFYAEAGTSAFDNDGPVPHAISNSRAHALNVARVVLALARDHDLGPGSSLTVIDVGSGTGVFAYHLVRLLQELNTTGARFRVVLADLAPVDLERVHGVGSPWRDLVEVCAPRSPAARCCYCCMTVTIPPPPPHLHSYRFAPHIVSN
jgi:hypothetical protein